MKVKKQILVLFLTMLVEIPILSAPKQKRTKKTKGGSCRKVFGKAEKPQQRRRVRGEHIGERTTESCFRKDHKTASGGGKGGYQVERGQGGNQADD